MSNEETVRYTVMELSDHLGVKRTTVNDWLTKYAMYIESSVQGKRKTYTERSLEVLKTIARLRGDGLSSFEIESKLSELFAVHPLASSPEPAEKPAPVSVSPEDEKKENASAAQEQVPERISPEAIIARKDAAELLRQFQMMMEKIDRLEAAANALPPPAPAENVPQKKSGKNGLVWCLFVLFALILLAGGAFAYTELRNMKDLASEQAQANEQLQKNIADQSLRLIRSQEDVKRLGDEVRAADQRLTETKQAFDQASKAQAALHKAESDKLNLQLKNERLAAEKSAAEKKTLELEKAQALTKAASAEKARQDAEKAKADALKARQDAEKAKADTAARLAALEKKISDAEKARQSAEKTQEKAKAAPAPVPAPKAEIKPANPVPAPKADAKPAK